MSDICSGGFDDRASRRSALILRLADRLYLAAAPTFALMSLLTVLADDRSALCSADGASAMSGMAPMYLLMSAFHLPPWLKLIAAQPSRSTERTKT